MNRRIIYLCCLLIIVAAAFTGCSPQQRSDINISDKTHSAVTPSHRFNWWGARHHQILDRVKQGNVDLVFIGDSITHGWESGGAALWQQYYAPHNAVNMGFGGDQTQHLLWRFDHGEIDDISPKVAVILIGVNNLHGGHTPQQTADGIEAVCLALRARLSNTKILLLGIFPYKENPGDMRNKIIETNRIVSKLADGKMIHYLDFGDKFLRPDKTMSAEIMPDFLHPNAAGYKIWADQMEPKLAKLMGE